MNVEVVITDRGLYQLELTEEQFLMVKTVVETLREIHFHQMEQKDELNNHHNITFRQKQNPPEDAFPLNGTEEICTRGVLPRAFRKDPMVEARYRKLYNLL